MTNAKIKKLIDKYDLDLSGLTILTEAASGAYFLNPFIALAAGAKKVICQTKTTTYGQAKGIIQQMLSYAQRFNFDDRIIVKEELASEDWSQVDIITNSGHLRPISKEKIELLKPTAVIPLMWETWEYRKDDLDLKATKDRNILVLGTDESSPPCDMKPYAAMIGVKLMLESGLEIASNKIILLGSTTTLCLSIKRALEFLGAEVIWFSSDNSESEFYYSTLNTYLRDSIETLDGILVAEHHCPVQLNGEGGLFSFQELSRLNPELKIGISCGNVDQGDLKKSNLHYFPKQINPFGYMTYQSFHVGSFSVMDLFAAGLKVGEVMARSRLKGLSTKDSAQYALKNSPAEDFSGDLSWL